jgi:hypothetical protein
MTSRRTLLAVGLLCLLGGPVAAAAMATSVVWRSRHVVDRATAEVVEVRISRSANSTHYCPTFRWEHQGVAHVERSRYCGEYGEFEAGQRVAVRFAASDPGTVTPDTFFATYGDAGVFLPATLIPTFLLYFCVSGWRKRQRMEKAGILRPDGTFDVDVGP